MSPWRMVSRICIYCGERKSMHVDQRICDDCEQDSRTDKDFQEEYKDA